MEYNRSQCWSSTSIEPPSHKPIVMVRSSLRRTTHETTEACTKHRAKWCVCARLYCNTSHYGQQQKRKMGSAQRQHMSLHNTAYTTQDRRPCF